jgi:serine/threonine protein phosphatase 1
MANRYIITDIHGCNKTFQKLVKDVIPLTGDDQLYLLGDFVDRGPDSKGVLDFIMDLMVKYHVRVIRGNHDQIMLDSRHDLELFNSWVSSSGGDTTMESFHTKGVESIPDVYFDLINDMEYYIELEDAFLVHAGFDFTKAEPFSDFYSMMYIRDFPIDNNIVKYKKIIHGHTPVPLSRIEQGIESGFQEINIDNGCVFGSAYEYGSLVALELNEMRLFVQPNVD